MLSHRDEQQNPGPAPLAWLTLYITLVLGLSDSSHGHWQGVDQDVERLL